MMAPSPIVVVVAVDIVAFDGDSSISESVPRVVDLGACGAFTDRVTRAWKVATTTR